MFFILRLASWLSLTFYERYTLWCLQGMVSCCRGNSILPVDQVRCAPACFFYYRTPHR